MANRTILIVDDEELLRESLAGLLEGESFEVLKAADGRAALDLVLQRPVDLVLSDVRMPGMDGAALLTAIRKAQPQTPVILMTAYGSVDSAVAAMREGAWDYLIKPVKFDDLLLKIERALAFREMAEDRRVLADQVASGSAFHDLVSEAPRMLELFELVRKLSTVKSSVLVVGESGTGKELFARAIHYNGITRGKPFVAVNCGAIPESLMESELFGHRKGAFTGAIRDKTGFFQAAHGGTLFLDELSSLTLPVQSSLLRVLEERAVVPVGDTRPQPIDVRIVGASNRDLEEMVQAGEFRNDLLYRLRVVQLDLPPLRDRKGDIPLLVHHFLDRFARQMSKQVTGITNDAMRGLLNYRWPGNVRELQNVIERAVIFADGREIDADDLPFRADGVVDDLPGTEDLKESLRQFERQHIIYSLRRHGYDKGETARHLGIGMSSLYRKLDELGIPKNLEEHDADRA